jgi:hypothetical protein
VLTGTFFLNQRHIIILFDFGASHDFMSSTCGVRVSYVISTPGDRVEVDHMAQKVSFKLSRKVFSTNLIILSGQGVDVILGMSWMKMHKVVLDTATRLVHLNSPMYGKLTMHLLVISHIKASLHHVVERKI